MAAEAPDPALFPALIVRRCEHKTKAFQTKKIEMILTLALFMPNNVF